MQDIHTVHKVQKLNSRKSARCAPELACSVVVAWCLYAKGILVEQFRAVTSERCLRKPVPSVVVLKCESGLCKIWGEIELSAGRGQPESSTISWLLKQPVKSIRASHSETLTSIHEARHKSGPKNNLSSPKNNLSAAHCYLFHLILSRILDNFKSKQDADQDDTAVG